jgi:hypothetical protein
VREHVEEVRQHAGDVFCVVAAEVEVVPVVDMIVMTVAVASGCWFVAVVPESAPLIAPVKSVQSVPSILNALSKRRLLQHPRLLLLLLLVMTHRQLLVPLLHQRSLVRQSLLHFK